MMMRRASAALVAAAAALAMLAGPASAGTAHNRYISDRKWDVEVNGGASHFTWKQRAAVDLTHVHYWTTTHRFKVRFTVRSLRRDTARPEVLLMMEGRAADGLEVGWNPGSRPFVQDAGVRSCRAHSIRRLNYRLDYVQISFPKRCFPAHHKYSQDWAETWMGTGVNHWIVDNTSFGRYIYV